MRPHVARPVDDVARRIVDRRQTFDHAAGPRPNSL
jgi:hypothetical protein